MSNGIEITNVEIFPIKSPQEGSKLRGYAKLIMNDAFAVNSIRIVDGKNGLFIAFPDNYSKDQDKSYSIANPVTAELREEIQNAVLQAYHQKIDDGSQY